MTVGSMVRSPAGSTVRVVVADDDALLRAGLAVVLETADDLEVVGQAGDGTAAVALCALLAPDVALLDVRMPGVDGVEAARRIRALCPGTRVLVLTTFRDDDVVAAALAAGASGFLLKRSSPERLLAGVRAVAAGEAPLDPAVARGVIERSLRASAVAVGEADAARRQVRSLTPREVDVLRLVGRGLANAEVAAALVIAESTVQSHVKHVLAELGVRDRAQAVVVAHRSGLVDDG